MSAPLFGEREINIWNDWLDNKPDEISEAEWASGAIPVVTSFRPGATNAGMLLRLRTASGGEYDLEINPVAARHLAACILTMGQQAGWIDAKGDVIAPLRPSLDA